jgi:guanylate kinase
MCSSSGTLFVLAGPSGAGKSTLAEYLVESLDEAVFSVSTTTRAPRGSEVEGEHYFFTTTDNFRRMAQDGYFLEWAEVHGNFYGTCAETVRSQLFLGRSVILDIDVQGAVQVKEKIPSAVLIFILPGSREVLRSRLLSRNTDSSGTVELRMKAAAGEVARMGSFDYFIRNDDLDRAKSTLLSIYNSEKARLRNLVWPRAGLEYHPGHYRGLSHWKGKRVAISSGPTREMIDDVRFISNRSSGLMGVSLAGAFHLAGADVTLISGPACRMDPPGPVRLVRTSSARDMQEALLKEASLADLVVMAAAVADYGPESVTEGKLRRTEGSLLLKLAPTPDIIASLAGKCTVLAFALEYGGTALESARDKMVRKGAKAIFMNRGDSLGTGMESPDNSGILVFSGNRPAEALETGSKTFTALGIAAAMGRYMMENNGG